MGDVPRPSLSSSPPPPPKSNMPMLYYGLVVVGTAALVLAIYNLLVIRWCAHRQDQSGLRANRFVEVRGSRSFENVNRNLLSSFKYKKEGAAAQDQATDSECAVCLSVFEEGEEIRRLPRCNHSFHAPCIDMWLYSHSDCPLCRAFVDPPLPYRHVVDTPENSREGLLDSGISA